MRTGYNLVIVSNIQDIVDTNTKEVDIEKQ